MSRLREFYKTDAVPAMVKQFSYKNKSYFDWKCQ